MILIMRIMTMTMLMWVMIMIRIMMILMLMWVMIKMRMPKIEESFFARSVYHNFLLRSDNLVIFRFPLHYFLSDIDILYFSS